MGAWLQWWCAPVGSGPVRRRSRSRSRSRSSGAPGTLAWWLAKPGTPARGTATRSTATNWGPGSLAWWMARPGTPAPAPDRVAVHDRVKVRGGPRTCPLCKKAAACRCTRVTGEPIPRRRRPAGAVPYTYPPDFRANGAVWCGNCRHRISGYDGHCLNKRCPR